MITPTINENGFYLMEIYDKLNDGQAELIWFHCAVSSSKSSDLNHHRDCGTFGLSQDIFTNSCQFKSQKG